MISAFSPRCCTILTNSPSAASLSSPQRFMSICEIPRLIVSMSTFVGPLPAFAAAFSGDGSLRFCSPPAASLSTSRLRNSANFPGSLNCPRWNCAFNVDQPRIPNASAIRFSTSASVPSLPVAAAGA